MVTNSFENETLMCPMKKTPNIGMQILSNNTLATSLAYE
jgi:hypothetical protein